MQSSSPSGCYWPSLTMQFTGTFSSNNFPSKHFWQRIEFLIKLLLFLKLDFHYIAFHWKLWEAYWQRVSIYWKYFMFQPLSAWEKTAYISLFLFYIPKVSIIFPPVCRHLFHGTPQISQLERSELLSLSSDHRGEPSSAEAALRMCWMLTFASCTQPARPCSPPGNPQKLIRFAVCTSSVGTGAFFAALSCSVQLYPHASLCSCISSSFTPHLWLMVWVAVHNVQHSELWGKVCSTSSFQLLNASSLNKTSCTEQLASMKKMLSN